MIPRTPTGKSPIFGLYHSPASVALVVVGWVFHPIWSWGNSAVSLLLFAAALGLAGVTTYLKNRGFFGDS